MNEYAGDYQTKARMTAKQQAIPLPNLVGKSVLDVGCDHGFWCKLASDMGASYVLGVDRGRVVRHHGFVNLVARNTARQWPRCQFMNVDLGKEWPWLGKFDVVFAFSIYHHLYAAADGNHDTIWKWLHQQTQEVLLWEGPLSTRDGIAKVRAQGRKNYTREAILTAANKYFQVEVLGPALHRPHREVLRCTPRSLP